MEKYEIAIRQKIQNPYYWNKWVDLIFFNKGKIKGAILDVSKTETGKEGIEFLEEVHVNEYIKTKKLDNTKRIHINYTDIKDVIIIDNQELDILKS